MPPLHGTVQRPTRTPAPKTPGIDGIGVTGIGVRKKGGFSGH